MILTYHLRFPFIIVHRVLLFFLTSYEPEITSTRLQLPYVSQQRGRAPFPRLKAYSQVSNRGRSQKIQTLHFLHLFIGLP